MVKKKKNGISRNLPSRARLRAATSLISLGFEAAKSRGFLLVLKRNEQWPVATVETDVRDEFRWIHASLEVVGNDQGLWVS